MRRISLSVLAGVALLGAAVVLLSSVSVSASLSQPTVRFSAQLVPAPRSRLTSSSPELAASSPGLRQQLSQFLLVHPLFATPPSATPVRRGPKAIQAAPLIEPRLPDGMSCPVATGSDPGGCSIVPCAVYVGAADAVYAPSVPGLGVAVLPRVIRKPSPGGTTPAGTCVSRPGRPPQTRWVSSASR